MAIQYIPSGYQQRPRRTGWDMMLPQMAQALFGSMLQERAWEKRFGKEQEAGAEALGEKRGYEERQWQKRYGGQPTPVKEGGRTIGHVFGGKFSRVPKSTEKETWGEPKWHKEMNAFVTTSSLGNTKKFSKDGWKAATKEEAMGLRKAGAPSMTQVIAGEKWPITKEITVGQARTSLSADKKDKNIYESNKRIFNKQNVGNEITYWDTDVKGLFGGEQAKIMKIPKEAIAAGWTAKMIQEAADRDVMTVRQKLINLGILKPKLRMRK